MKWVVLAERKFEKNTRRKKERKCIYVCMRKSMGRKKEIEREREEGKEIVISRES